MKPAPAAHREGEGGTKSRYGRVLLAWIAGVVVPAVLALVALVSATTSRCGPGSPSSP